MTRKCTTMLLALLALVVVASTLHAQGDNSDRGIVPPQARFRGFTRGELGAIFWQTALSIPIVEGDHPFISGGAMQGPDGIVFLTGVFSTDPAVVEITIPAGTPLFFPVINAECSMFEPDPFHGDDEEELRQCANTHIDHTSGHFASVDGRAVGNLEEYRTESPLFVWGPLPEDNLLGAPAGTVSPAVDAGVYLLLSPLSVGQHIVHFGGTFDDFGASINTVYVINVVPQ